MLLEKATVANDLRSLLDGQVEVLPPYFADDVIQNRVGKYISDISASERRKQRSLKVMAEIARRSGDAGQRY